MEEEQKSVGHDNPKSSGASHSHSDISKPGPRNSQQKATHSAAGAAMKGMPHTSRLEQAVEKVHESARCTQDTENVSHIAVQTWWVLLSPNSEECTMLSSDTDPKTWREAMAADDAPDWIEGLKEEMASLRAHNVFTLVPRHSIPMGGWIVKSIPHCHQKHNEHGNIVCWKVRVVAKGYTQVLGVDFKETFTPVMHLESIWSVLHIGVTNDWEIDHLDVKTAFLHGDLDEEFYMEQPKGAKEAGKEDWVCWLNKSLYGLHQASCQWSKNLHDCLTKEGFMHCAAEYSIYT